MDLIKREDAIKAIEETPFIRRPILPHYLIAKIKDIPSADKKGEWISLHNGKWKCSECGIEVLIYAKGNFCPNCGTRMFPTQMSGR